MLDLVKSRKVYYPVAAVLVFVAAFVYSFLSNYEEVPFERPDRVVLGDGFGNVPLTGVGATVEGWSDSFKCAAYSANRIFFKVTTREGRFFTKANEPYSLVYKALESGDALLAIYFFSDTEMPEPWIYEKDGLIGTVGLDHAHWALPVFFRDPKTPCGRRSFAASGS